MARGRQESKRVEPGVATPLPGGVRMKLQHTIQPRTENDMTTGRTPYRAFLDRIPVNDNSQEDTDRKTNQADAA